MDGKWRKGLRKHGLSFNAWNLSPWRGEIENLWIDNDWEFSKIYKIWSHKFKILYKFQEG